MKSRKDDSNWISISDMMTSLMVIFMFIAINYIVQVTEYKFIETNVYNALVLEFEKEIRQGQIELSPNGTVTFNPPRMVLFNVGSSKLTGEFSDLLDAFIPRYLKVISNRDYVDHVQEIRIEGHTDTIPPLSGGDSYQYNLNLSSQRAISVLEKRRNSRDFKILNDSLRERLEFLLTANGFSYSRSLNDQHNLVYTDSNKVINNNYSRRVEFRVITSNEKLANELYAK